SSARPVEACPSTGRGKGEGELLDCHPSAVVGEVPKELRVGEAHANATVAGADVAEVLIAAPVVQVKGVALVGEVLRVEHVLQNVVFLRADGLRSHGLVLDAVDDLVGTRRCLPAVHTSGDVGRVKGRVPDH